MVCTVLCVAIFCFEQKTAYELRTSDWSSDVCSSDLDTISAAANDIVTTARTAGNRVVGGGLRAAAEGAAVGARCEYYFIAIDDVVAVPVYPAPQDRKSVV